MRFDSRPTKRLVLLGAGALLIVALIIGLRFAVVQPIDEIVDVTISNFPLNQTSTTLRVAVPGLPPGLGNPFTSISIPTIYTWAAIFDSLTYVTEDGEILPWLATS